ncbi:MAG: SpaA isopeptide-forming pilin-related protein, partial [Hungatella sp.]
VLVETKVPQGFAKSADSVIEVGDMPDVQYYDIENEVSAIRISKVSGSGSKELAGAKLGLYRADAADGFTQSDELLVTSWTTGTDGTYSEEDFINNRIPDGYVQGDFRPHTITRLADGAYYLAELASPDYYTMFAPIRIDYKQEDAIRAGNVPAEGELVIEKMDSDGNALRGAVFEVKAYRKNGEVAFETTTGATTGSVTLKHLPVGETADHGSVQPYRYKVRETISPEGYAVNTLLETFSFAPSKNGVSYGPGEAAVIRLQIKNEPTRLYIEKRDFDRLEATGADGIFVDGAVLAVYEVHGKDEEDNYIYSESDLFTTWTTKAGARHLIKGLVAGRSYLLKELKAPAGYNLMEPVIFTVSSDGRKISRLTNDLNSISVNYIQMSDAYTDTDNRDLDSINSVTISGRYVSKTEMEMTDQDGTVVAGWISTGAGQTLTPAADIVDGEVYTFTERTCYSDGSMMVTGKTTRQIHFDEQGLYHVADRAAKQVTLALKKAADGTLIRDYSPSEYFTSETIKNNVNPENPKITMMNREGKVGDAIDPNQAVWNRIFYVNTANITTDIMVTAKIDRTVQVIDVRGGVGDTDGGRMEGDSLTWIIRDVKPLHGGYVSFATEVSDRSAYAVSVKATLAFNGKTVTGTKETPILQPNRLTLVNELTGSGKELYADEESTFRVRLYSATGTELKGSYRYAGSRTGELKSGETITLSGNEFITIHPGSIYKNIRYQVERIPDGKTVTQRNAEGTVPESAGACYVASRSVSDTKDRELFEKGERYLLLETTEYTDQEIMESNKINFTLNDQAGIDGVGGYDKQTKVRIEKLDYDTGKPVTGAMMQILDRSGAIVEEWETTAAPRILTGRLTPGERYLLRETKAPEGYGYAKDIWFTVNRDGTMDTIIMEDRQTNVVVSKLDAESLNGLLGAVMAIVDQDGIEVERWVSTGQPHVIRGKLQADETYTLVEIAPPIGSAPAKDITFTVSHDGTIDSIVMYDPPTKLLVKKLVATASDARPGEPLTGATLQILHEDKTPATASNASPDFEPGEELIFTSQETFVRMLRQLIAGRTYYLHEVTPAPGYAYAEDVPFTVSMDGTQDVVVMYDLPTGVSIDKQNRADGQGITGAVMQLLDPAGRIIKEWVSTGKPVLFLGELIAKATYTLREVKAPEGYAHAEDMTFTVSKDGSHDMVVMYDEPTEVSILKVEASTGKPLAGALMQVVDPLNAAVMDEWESTTEPHSIKGRLTADKSYLLREIKAPSGYGLQRDLEFKVPYGAETVKLTFDNRRLMPPEPGDEFLDFKKISTDGTPLAGAEFTFYREDGSVYAQAVSNSRGVISMVKPGDGTYTYRETKAPDGYLLNPEVYSFTVQYGSVITERLPVINHKSPEVVIEKTDAVTNGRVGGAV